MGICPYARHLRQIPLSRVREAGHISAPKVCLHGVCLFPTGMQSYDKAINRRSPTISAAAGASSLIESSQGWPFWIPHSRLRFHGTGCSGQTMPNCMMPLHLQVLHSNWWCAHMHTSGMSGAAAELSLPLASCVHGSEAVLRVVDCVQLRLPLQQGCRSRCYHQIALVQKVSA